MFTEIIPMKSQNTTTVITKQVAPTKKIKCFEDALSFYSKTRKGLPKLITEAQELLLELGTDECLLDEDNIPTPLQITKDLNISQEEMGQWLGTNLAHYSKTLNDMLPTVDKNVEVVPKLISGLIEEAKSGNIELDKLLKRIKKEAKTLTPENSENDSDAKEIDEIEKQLNSRVHRLTFFKEEVDERFESFKDSLIEYISNYTLLNHILTCAQTMVKTPNINSKQMVKKLTQLKKPF